MGALLKHVHAHALHNSYLHVLLLAGQNTARRPLPHPHNNHDDDRGGLPSAGVAPSASRAAAPASPSCDDHDCRDHDDCCGCVYYDRYGGVASGSSAYDHDNHSALRSGEGQGRGLGLRFPAGVAS